MCAMNREMQNLVDQHEGIRAHMRFLARSLANLDKQAMQIRDKIWTYRWGLWDFREAVRQHIELDEKIFKTCPPGEIPAEITGGAVYSTVALIGETMGEHSVLIGQLDEVIALADKAVENTAPPADLKKIAADIKEKFSNVTRAIEEHTSMEDRLISYVNK